MIRLAAVLLYLTLVGFGCPPKPLPETPTRAEPPEEVTEAVTGWCFKTLASTAEGDLEVSSFCTQREGVCWFVQDKVRLWASTIGVKFIGECELR